MGGMHMNRVYEVMSKVRATSVFRCDVTVFIE